MDPVRETPLIKIARALRVLRKSGALAAYTPRGFLSFVRHAVEGAGIGSIHHVAALNHPDKTALLAGDRRVTYGELNDRINRLGNGLLSLGIAPGDTVIWMLKNSIECIETIYALGRIRATAVPVNPLYKEKELAYIMGNSGARGIIYGPESREAVHGAARSLGRPVSGVFVDGGSGETPEGAVPYEDLLASSAGTYPSVRAAGDEVITIMYTSGTTGKPKGAPRTQANSGTGAFVTVLEAFPLHHDDTHLILGPLFHSAPLVFAHFHSALGATIAVMDRFDPERTLDAMSGYGVSSVFMVPTMLHAILSLPRATLRARRFPSLKALIVAAAPFSTHLKKAALEYFGQVVYEFYGASEIGVISVASPGDLALHPSSVGRILPATEVAILNERGRRLSPGRIGELFVRNEQTISGYYCNDEASRSSRRGEFFSVGDLASVDRDGYLYLAGRKVDMVISGGINVYPAEIEEALLEHPKIADAAVIGVPDDYWGEALMAFIVPRERGLTVEEVLEFCGGRLAPHKKPKHVRFVEEIPHNATGKVLKRDLRSLVTP